MKPYLIITVFGIFFCSYVKKGNITIGCNVTQIDSVLWNLVDKYQIPYTFMNEHRDSINIEEKFPVVKSITYMDGFTIEIRPFLDGQVHIEIFLFYNESVITAVPFYGIQYYDRRLKHDTNSYLSIFEVELNWSYSRILSSLINRTESLEHFNSKFWREYSYVDIIMTNSHYFPYIQMIKDSFDYLRIKSRIEIQNSKSWNSKFTISKQEAIENLNNLQDQNDKSANYTISFNSILKFKCDTLHYDKPDKIHIEHINKELFKEIIF